MIRARAGHTWPNSHSANNQAVQSWLSGPLTRRKVRKSSPRADHFFSAIYNRVKVQKCEPLVTLSPWVKTRWSGWESDRSQTAFAGDITPVLAKHSKRFSLVDCISVGVDHMQRKYSRRRS